MATLKELKNQIASVKNTQKTTHAMKLVSTAKLKRAEEAMLLLRDYAKKIDEVMNDISSRMSSVKDTSSIRAFSDIQEVKKIDLIVISADKGLCGGFNHHIIKETLNKIDELKSKNIKIRLKVIGKKAIEYFKFIGIDLFEEYINLSSSPNYEKAVEVISNSYKDFVNEDIDNIILIYNGYVNKLTQQVHIQELLPIKINKVNNNEYLEVEPKEDYEIILESLVKKYIDYMMYFALLDSLAGEHSARMQAMESATNNAKDMVHQLTLAFNKARQESVTRELIEIVTAMEAMKKK